MTTKLEPVQGLEPGREWYDPRTDPTRKQTAVLRVSNSLTNTKVEFIPLNGKIVTWYACGPTVYDVAHLGHARNYVSFDVVRRIMEDYFGYQVHMVMNVTDVDDKIIKRSNENKEAFSDLTRRFEKEFWADMKALGVRMPSNITRVSEYIPEIVKFVEKIEDNGFAYPIQLEGEKEKSMYFDVAAYRKSHVYGKLQPRSVGNQALIAEGEGALTVKDMERAQKRDASDFALWKKSKDNEPKWPSNRWGEGRPGWHIECSAMASDILGDKIDIHSGGEDLKFPHHDNEIAQSEGCFGHHQWINYFLHAGHLHIEGLKMSKSLKNFITIKASLQRWSARQIRFLFIAHKYNSGMDYAESTMHQAADREKLFFEFFQNAHVFIRDEAKDSYHPERYTPKEQQMITKLYNTKIAVHEALCDDFDTPTALDQLQELVRVTNVYMNDRASNPRGTMVSMIADYITDMFRCFGVIDTHGDFGFATTSSSNDQGMAKVLDVLTAFRDNVRDLSLASLKKTSDPSSIQALLNLCDQLRDEVLPPIGVRLEDRAGQGSAWKLDDPEAIKRDIEQKIRVQKEKAAQKEEQRKRDAERQQQKLLQGAVDPKEMFKAETDKYSKFDENGVPTHDAAGAELSKGARKKLLKDQEKQVELHNWYLDQAKK